MKKWTSWAYRSRMPDTIKLGKTLKRHLNGILEAIKTGINSAVVEGINNRIRTAFRHSYGFKAQEHSDTIMYLVAGWLKFPPQNDKEIQKYYSHGNLTLSCLCRFF